MEIKEIPTPTMPDWLKLYNTYDPEYYAPGKRVSAEEWNTLFLASVRQGNYNADTLELLIKTYLPETYLTQVDFNQFSNEMRTAYSTFTNNIQEGFIAHKTQVQAQYDTFTTQVQEDFTALTSEVNSLEERVVKAEDVAYSLNDVIQEANEYAQLANQTAIESNTFAQEAKDNASTALETANNAASVAASSNSTAQDALSTAQSAVTTANNAATQATQAVNTANAASLRAEDAIATANAAKAESAAAKNTAAQAETTANASNTTAASANNTASEAKRIAQNALDLVTEGQGSQVIVNGVAVDTFNADTKADLDYVDRQIAALIGAAPETLDTLEEVAKAIKENETVVDALNAAIGTKANKADIEPTIQFAESERQKSKNLWAYGDVSGTQSVYIPFSLKAGTYTISANVVSSDTDGNTCLISFEKLNSTIITKFTLTRGNRSSRTFTLTEDCEQIGYYASYQWNTGANDTFSFSDIQIEEGSVATDYQPYNGAIAHLGDAPVVFAEREKNRAINLFNYKIQAGTSDVTNNQDGSFTISNLTFYYPSLRLNTALKPNTKYTFAETVLEVSDSVGLEASNVAFGVVAYYTDGTYSATQEIPIRGTGRYSGTFTTNNKTIDYVEYRILRKNNSTSILNGKVTDISVCEGDNTVYYAYEGATVHEEQLKDYLPLAGGTMTGRISFADGNVALPETDDLQFITGIESYAAGGGMIYTHRDTFKQKLLQTNGAIIKGRVYGSGDDEGLIIEKADNGFASLCLGSATGTRSVFYLKSDDSATWKWSNGSSSYDISHPQKAGTIALTSDISIQNFTTYTVIDATALDENTWYPVTFDASRKNLKIMLFNQWNGGNPSWATHSTKNYGCVKIWETTGHGWGELGTYRKVYLSVFTYANTDPVRGIGQLGNSSTEYVYVRGGGKYNFYTSHNVVPVLRTSTYTVASQSIAPTTTAPAEIVQTIMSTDTDQTISGSKTFTSDIALTKATPLINVTSTSTSGDTSIRFTRSDTGNSCYFGIGSGGVNRGFYDLKQNRWVIYCDGSKSILNSATVPSGQTLTIAGTLNLIV